MTDSSCYVFSYRLAEIKFKTSLCNSVPFLSFKKSSEELYQYKCATQRKFHSYSAVRLVIKNIKHKTKNSELRSRNIELLLMKKLFLAIVGRLTNKRILLLFFIIATTNCIAQKFQPNWQSLNTRGIPSWFKDAKFGIFIHWGVYAVPSYAPVIENSGDSYAEWYWYRVNEGNKYFKA